MILRFFPDFPQTYGEISGFHLTGGLLWYPRRSLSGVTCLFLISIYIYINIYRVPFIFDSSRVITPTTGLMEKPQPTVTRPLVHFGAGSHPLSYCTHGCCPSMNFGSP